MARSKVEISSSLLAYNVLLTFIGQAVSLVVVAVTIPFITRSLGTERFGLFSLAWVIFGYFTVFDLGLGRATTKYIAEALGRGEEDQIPRLLWTSVTVQAILGLIGASVLVTITPLLVGRILNILPEFVSEAKIIFYLLALGIPIVLVSSSFSGVLEAKQHFDLVNVVRISLSTLAYLLALVGLLLGLGLPGIIGLILIVRLAALSAFIALSFHVFPKLREFSFSYDLFVRLLSFGGWVTVSNLVIPIFVYVDRFLIGSILTMSAVAYYTAPYELATRLFIIPSSIATVLFPAFSTLGSQGDIGKIDMSVARSTKYLIIAMSPITVVFLIFAEDILRVWLGNDFAMASTSIFRLLNLAVFLNAIGYIPFTLIQGLGRPDVVAKYHLIELPIYIIVTFSLTNKLGISGTALAWCLRMMWTIPTFFFVCIRIAMIPLKSLLESGLIRTLVVVIALFVASISFTQWANPRIAVAGLVTAGLIISYVLLIWYVAFDMFDRNLAKYLINKLHNFLLGERWICQM